MKRLFSITLLLVIYLFSGYQAYAQRNYFTHKKDSIPSTRFLREAKYSKEIADMYLGKASFESDVIFPTFKSPYLSMPFISAGQMTGLLNKDIFSYNELGLIYKTDEEKKAFLKTLKGNNLNLSLLSDYENAVGEISYFRTFKCSKKTLSDYDPKTKSFSFDLEALYYPKKNKTEAYIIIPPQPYLKLSYPAKRLNFDLSKISGSYKTRFSIPVYYEKDIKEIEQSKDECELIFIFRLERTAPVTEQDKTYISGTITDIYFKKGALVFIKITPENTK